MSSARSHAQINFALKVLSNALWDYGKKNNGQFPIELSQLNPYFKSPVDDSVLQEWTILPMNSLPDQMRIDGDWVITQKAPVNPAFDQRIVFSVQDFHMFADASPNHWDVGP